MWHILSGKDHHGAETMDLGLFMRSTQLLRLNWKLVLTYQKGTRESKWTVHTGHVYKTWPSATFWTLMCWTAALSRLTDRAANPVSISSSWRATGWGQWHREGCSPQQSSPDLGSDSTKSNLKDSPDPLLDSRHHTLFALPWNREETEKEENKKTMPEAAQPANKLGKAAGLQPPGL